MPSIRLLLKRNEIHLPHLHIKVELMKTFAKSMSKVGRGLIFIEHKLSRINERSIYTWDRSSGNHFEMQNLVKNSSTVIQKDLQKLFSKRSQIRKLTYLITVSERHSEGESTLTQTMSWTNATSLIQDQVSQGFGCGQREDGTSEFSSVVSVCRVTPLEPVHHGDRRTWQQCKPPKSRGSALPLSQPEATDLLALC